VALALPAWLLAAAGIGIIAVVESQSEAALNLTEAAVAEDSAAVARLVDEGHDVNARRAVRPGLAAGDASPSTPLEAAVIGRRPELVSFLVGHGARPDAAVWPALWCGAIDTGDRDVIAALEPARPAGVVADCQQER
jgi:hypothetical protein